MLITILSCFALVALAEIIAYISLLAKKAKEDKERAALLASIEAQERREAEAEARRSDLLETLSAAYKKAKGAGVHNFYLLALSHCCQLLREGEEIDEGAALLALRGLEGDAEIDARVRAKLYQGAGE